MSDPSQTQPAILSEVPAHAVSLLFDIEAPGPTVETLQVLKHSWESDLVVGIGPALTTLLGKSVEGLRPFPNLAEKAELAPATDAALWLWVTGAEEQAVSARASELAQKLAPAFSLRQQLSLFKYRDGRDLTGYEDGTENPRGERAIEVATAEGAPGLAGGSFAFVQQWVHDLELFASFPQGRKDHTFGRRLSDNEELEDAPQTAHVKRTAQESFEPEAFVLRRSMPYATDEIKGLLFLAFGRTLDPVEALLGRMVGLEDGLVDALFDFTHPVSGATFWCPPLLDGSLDLRQLGRFDR